MTIEELAREMNVSTHYINHHWKQICASWAKRGIKLVKNGKGMSADYGVIENGAVSARFEYKGDQYDKFNTTANWNLL